MASESDIDLISEGWNLPCSLEIDPQMPQAKRQAILQAFKKSGSLSLAPIMAEREDRIVRGYMEGKGEMEGIGDLK